VSFGEAGRRIRTSAEVDTHFVAEGGEGGPRQNSSCRRTRRERVTRQIRRDETGASATPREPRTARKEPTRVKGNATKSKASEATNRHDPPRRNTRTPAAKTPRQTRRPIRKIKKQPAPLLQIGCLRVGRAERFFLQVGLWWHVSAGWKPDLRRAHPEPASRSPRRQRWGLLGLLLPASVAP